MCRHICALGGLKLIYNVFLDHSVFLLRQGIYFSKVRACWFCLVQLASQVVLGIPSFVLHDYCHYKLLPHLPSMWFWGFLNSSSLFIHLPHQSYNFLLTGKNNWIKLAWDINISIWDIIHRRSPIYIQEDMHSRHLDMEVWKRNLNWRSSLGITNTYLCFSTCGW